MSFVQVVVLLEGSPLSTEREENSGLGSGSEEAVGEFQEKSCWLSTS